MNLLWLTVAPLDVPGYCSTQYEMVRELEKSSWEVRLMSKRSTKDTRSSLPIATEKVILVPRTTRLRTEVLYHRRFLSEWRRARPDVVLFEPAHFRIVMPFALLSLFGLTRTKFVLDIRTPPLKSDSFNYWLEQLNLRITLGVSKRVLPGMSVITRALGQRLDLSSAYRYALEFWESAVNPEVFAPKRHGPRKKLPKYLNDRFVYFYHGTLSLGRNLINLIDAVALLHEQSSEISLVLLGSGSGESALQTHVRNRGMEQVVFILPPVAYEEVPGFIDEADVGVIPLQEEECWHVSSPLKLFEYMAMELPVVLTRIDAHVNVLGAESPGVVYVKSGSVEHLAEGLDFARRNVARLKIAAKSLRGSVLEGHCWSHEARKLDIFLRSLGEEPYGAVG